jgi:hypothetical protein
LLRRVSSSRACRGTATDAHTGSCRRTITSLAAPRRARGDKGKNAARSCHPERRFAERTVVEGPPPIRTTGSCRPPITSHAAPRLRACGAALGVTRDDWTRWNVSLLVIPSLSRDRHRYAHPGAGAERSCRSLPLDELGVTRGKKRGASLSSRAQVRGANRSRGTATDTHTGSCRRTITSLAAPRRARGDRRRLATLKRLAPRHPELVERPPPIRTPELSPNDHVARCPSTSSG